MHDTALLIGSAAIKLYGPRRRGLFVELGSMNVNGSLRSSAPTNSKYIGIDQAPGFGVDLVVPPGMVIPLDEGSADLVIASSVFEHDLMFWETFLQMCRLTKVGGHIYISAPSNGSIHRFPVDCWRFYPDAGLALEAYARKSGLAIRLIESFLAERIDDQWNDFVAVFKREDHLTNDKPQRKARLHEQFNCRNVYDVCLAECLRPDAPEDLRVIARLKQEATAAVPHEVHQRVANDAAIASQSLAQATQTLASLRTEAGIVAADVRDKTAEIERLSLALCASSQERTHLERVIEDGLGSVQQRDAELQRRSADLEQVRKELASHAQKLDEKAGRILSLKSELDVLSRQNADQNLLISDLGSRKAMLQHEAAQLSSQIESQAATIVELERNAAVAAAERRHLQEQLSDRDASIESLKHALEDAEQAQEELSMREQDVMDLMQALRKVNQEVDRLSGDVIKYRTIAEESRNALAIFASAFRQDRKEHLSFFSLLERLTRRSGSSLKRLPPPQDGKS